MDEPGDRWCVIGRGFFGTYSTEQECIDVAGRNGGGTIFEKVAYVDGGGRWHTLRPAVIEGPCTFCGRLEHKRDSCPEIERQMKIVEQMIREGR